MSVACSEVDELEPKLEGPSESDKGNDFEKSSSQGWLPPSRLVPAKKGAMLTMPLGFRSSGTGSEKQEYAMRLLRKRISNNVRSREQGPVAAG